MHRQLPRLLVIGLGFMALLGVAVPAPVHAQDVFFTQSGGRGLQNAKLNARMSKTEADVVLVQEEVAKIQPHAKTVIPQCASTGDKVRWDGDKWLCESETDPTVQSWAKEALPSCGSGQVLNASGGRFACTADGGVITETDPTVQQFAKNVLPSCGSGEVLAVAADGRSLRCAVDDKGMTAEFDPNVHSFADKRSGPAPTCASGQYLTLSSGVLSCQFDAVGLTVETDPLVQSFARTDIPSYSLAACAASEVLVATTSGSNVILQCQPASSLLSGALALNDLSDVDTAAQATGKVLMYNGTSWVAADEADPTVQSWAKTALGACGVGQVLSYDGTSLTCVTDSGSAGTIGLNDLTDVAIAGAAPDEVIRYNGTAWVNSSDKIDTLTSGKWCSYNGTNIECTTDAPLTCAASEVLKWNGTTWTCVNAASGLGLGTMATQNANNVSITGGTATLSTVTATTANLGNVTFVNAYGTGLIRTPNAQVSTLLVQGNGTVTGNLQVLGSLSISGSQTIDGVTFANGGIQTSGNIASGGISATNISATGNISAANFIGNGSQLTGVTAGSVNWPGITGVPSQVQAVSNSGNINLASLGVTGNISASGLRILSSSAFGGTFTPTSLITISNTIFGSAGGLLDAYNSSATRIAFLRTTSSNGGVFDVYTNAGASAIRLNSSGDSYIVGGNLGILTTTPSTSLHVNGTLRIANGAEACDANRAGGIRYNASTFEVCNGGGTWTALAIAGAPNWNTLTNIPTQVQAVSNSGNISLASLGVTGTVTATTVSATNGYFLNISGSGAGLYGIPASAITGMAADRISSTNNQAMVVATSAGTISFTTGGAAGTSYFDTIGRLVTPGISITTANGISSTNGYFTGNIGIGTNTPARALHISASTSALLRVQRTGTNANRWDFNITSSAADGLGAGSFAYEPQDFDADVAIRNIGNSWVWSVDTATGNMYVPIGSIGVGVSSALSLPTRMYVSGTLRLANGGEACDASRLGSIRFAGSDFEVCRNATTWETLASIASGGSPNWNTIIGIPTQVQAVSNSGNINLASLGVTGTITATTVSATNVYALNISGSGAGLYNIPASAITGLSTDRITSGTVTAIASNVNARIDISGSINLPTQDVAGTTANMIRENGNPFIHTFRSVGNDGANIFIGVNSGNTTMISTTSTFGASYNTGVGQNTLSNNTTGYNNTASGYTALFSNTTGFNNTAYGLSALRANNTGSNNTAGGMNALRFNTTGSNNTASGVNALLDVSASINTTAIGYNTGRGITTGNANTIVGANVTGLPAALSNTVIIADGNGNRRFYADALGRVGLNGITDPQSSLQVSGEAQVASSGATCSATNAGAIRYTAGVLQYCAGVGPGWTDLGAAGSADWYGLSNIPVAITNVSNGTIVSTTYGYFRYVSSTDAFFPNATISALSAGSIGANLISVSQVNSNNISATGTVQATNFVGSGAGLTGVAASTINWPSITGIPTQVQEVSNSGNINLASLGVTGTVTATTVSATNVYALNISGSGAGLYNIPASAIVGGVATDRISSTNNQAMVVATSAGTISLTTSGVEGTAYFDTLGRLVAPGISITTANGISSTNGYFSGNVGIGTNSPQKALDVVGDFDFRGVSSAGTVNLTNNNNDFIISNAGSGGASFRLLPWAGDIYFDNPLATGNQRFRTGTVDRLFISGSGNDGNIGIGTITPSSSLHVALGEAQVASSGASCSAALAGAIRYTGGALQYCAGVGPTWTTLAAAGGAAWSSITGIPTQVQAVSNSGNINLASLGVTGTVTATTVSATNVYALNISGSGAGLYNIPASAIVGGVATDRISSTNNQAMVVATSAGTISFTTGGVPGTAYFDTLGGLNAPHAYITNRIGIGTQSPSASLHLVSNGGLNSGLRLETLSTATYSVIDFQTPSGLLGQFLATGSGFSNGIFTGNQLALANYLNNSPLTFVAGGTGSYINFATGGYTASNEAMRILSDGKVGIGVTAPSTSLHISGTLRIANGGEACDSNRAGGIRYNAGTFEVCNGGGSWTALSTAGAPNWNTLTNIPTQVQAVSNSGNINLASLGVTGTVTATTVSATNVYALNISGSGAGLYNIPASAIVGGVATDRISSTNNQAMVVATSAGTVSFTLGGTAGAAYLHPSLGLVASGVSTTGVISAIGIYAGPYVRVISDTTTCDATTEGRISYNAGALFYCSGTSWTALAAGGSTAWASLTGVPTSINSLTTLTATAGQPVVFNGTTYVGASNLNLTSLGVTGTVTATTVSATNGYFRYVSSTDAFFPNATISALSAGSIGANLISVSQVNSNNISATGTVQATNFVGSGAGLTGVAASTINWPSITGIPTQVQAVSNSGNINLASLGVTGTITATTVSATNVYALNISGSGAGLYNIPASAITGLSTDRITQRHSNRHRQQR